ASGLPAGVMASFNPSSVTPPANGTVTSTLTVSTAFNSAVGTFTLTISGKRGSTTHSVTVGLTVNENAPVGGSQPTVGTLQNTAVAITLTATDVDNASL